MPFSSNPETSEHLLSIYSSIENRTQRITTQRPDWLCQKGCDQCCRQLAQPPVLTAAEWMLLWQGLCQLAPAQQAEVRQSIEALADRHCGPITCPLLDQTNGTCFVYAHRPAICRMYGFYSSGMHNLWCDMLQKRYEAGAFDEVVLGNCSPVDRALQYHGGKTQSLLAWYRVTTGGEDEVGTCCH